MTTTLQLKVDNLSGDVETKEWSHKISLGVIDGRDSGGLLQVWDPEKGEYAPRMKRCSRIALCARRSTLRTRQRLRFARVTVSFCECR